MSRSFALLRTVCLAALTSLPAVAAVALGTGAFAGCAQHQAQADRGSVEIVASGASALSLADIASVELTITATDLATPITQALAKTGTTWGGIVGQIPAGSGRTFSLTAFDATHAPIYGGRADAVTITAGLTAHVSITLQELVVAGPTTNAAPVITALAASATTVAPGATVALSATASDPNGDPLTYLWTDTDGALSVTNAASTLWTAPATPGDYTLTIAVNDPEHATSSLTITLHVAPQSAVGSAAVNVAINDSPVVSALGASANPIAAGQPVTLTLGASDPDGDALTYAWSTACQGAFSSATTQNPAFTLSAAETATSCTFNVVVDDGHGAHATGALGLAVGAGVAPSSPSVPGVVVDQSFQSTAHEGPGQTITFSVNVHTLTAPAVYVAWSADGGRLFDRGNQQSGVSDASSVVWRAPPLGGTYTITAYASDGDGAHASQTFVVSADPTVIPAFTSTLTCPCFTVPYLNATYASFAADPKATVFSAAHTNASGSVYETSLGIYLPATSASVGFDAQDGVNRPDYIAGTTEYSYCGGPEAHPPSPRIDGPTTGATCIQLLRDFAAHYDIDVEVEE